MLNTQIDTSKWKDGQMLLERCELKPQWVITSHLLKSLLEKRQEITSAEDVGKKEHLRTVGGNVNWCSSYGKQHGDSSKY